MTDRSAAIHERRGRWCILLATCLWSTSGLFAKAPLFESWPADSRGVMLAFWRALFASMALVPLVRRPRFRPAMITMTLAFAVMSATLLTGMTLGTAANAIWLQNTAPLWVFLLGLAFWHEPLHRRDLWPLAAGMLGVVVILGGEIGHSGLRGRAVGGALLGLASGLCYALVVVSLRRLRDESAFWLVALNHLASAVLLAPWCLAIGIWPVGEQWPVLALFGVGQMAIPYLLFAVGLRHVSSQEAAAISLVEPVLQPVWVLLAWGERPAPWTVAGAALILAGLALRYLWPSRQGAPSLASEIEPPTEAGPINPTSPARE